MILMIDCYDSFTYNLVQELAALSGTEIRVVRNDEAEVADLLALRPQAIVLSPGPGTPEQAGICPELVRASGSIPLLGVCLGHQVIAQVHGARVVRAPEPVHGKTSEIHHDRAGVFEGAPEPMLATRYHSLVVERDSVPAELMVTAWTADGLVMGLRHRSRPLHGIQFHPESYLTRHGMALLARFLELAGVPLLDGWQERARAMTRTTAGSCCDTREVTP
jgi:anthranilate synthase component 2